MDDIGSQLIAKATEMVRSGHKFVYVLENIDWEEKVHDMRKDSQNKSVHAVATSIVFSRVPASNLSDCGPQQDLRECNVRELVAMNEAELDAIQTRYRILLAKILFEHFPAFAKLKPYIRKATECQHHDEMSTKSEVITMPVLMKDEKKYAECVDVLDQLEKWTYNIYSAAGLCSSENPHSDDPAPPPPNWKQLYTRPTCLSYPSYSIRKRSFARCQSSVLWKPTDSSSLCWCKRSPCWLPFT